jgi:hypothetical protein
MTIPTIPSYLEKEFIVDDNMALLRNPNKLEQFLKFKEGEEIPPGFEAGMSKLIPLNTTVKVDEVKMDRFRNVIVHAVPQHDADVIPAGWTKATNLQGSFMNELIHLKPVEWDLIPQGDNYTVVDKKALIRTGHPDYKSIRETIPVGTYVEVTARSRQTEPEGKYLRVRHLAIENGEIVPGEPIGWTAASNLVEGNATVFKTNDWQDQRSDNAAWSRGRWIGCKVLVGIVGTGGQLQYIALQTMEPYLKLMEAAREDNIEISITSGFRTYSKQAGLYNGWKAGRPGFNRAAKPGSSNHQNGIAFDLNTGGYDGAPVYDWMKANATTHGFIRTVNREHWHWEYQPEKAAELKAAGTFKLSRVRV